MAEFRITRREPGTLKIRSFNSIEHLTYIQSLCKECLKFPESSMQCTELYRVASLRAERRDSSSNKSNFTRFQNNLNSKLPLFLFKAFCNIKRICFLWSLQCRWRMGNQKVTSFAGNATIERGKGRKNTRSRNYRNIQHCPEWHYSSEQTCSSPSHSIVTIIVCLYFNNHLFKHQSHSQCVSCFCKAEFFRHENLTVFYKTLWQDQKPALWDIRWFKIRETVHIFS